MPRKQSTAAKKARRLTDPAAGIEYTDALKYTSRPWWEPAPGEPDGITAELYGAHALTTEAGPAERARAEALWQPRMNPDLRCRCSGQCHHGEPCEQESYDGTCTGRIVHADRYPGSMFSVTAWFDEYGCPECGQFYERTVTLPALPWGEAIGDEQSTGIRVYDEVRHPNFPGVDHDDEHQEHEYDPGAAYEDEDPEDDEPDDDGEHQDDEDDGPDEDPDDFPTDNYDPYDAWEDPAHYGADDDAEEGDR